MIEHMPRKLQPIVGGIVMVIEGLSVIMWDLYFEYISPYALPFFILAATISFISTFGICFIPESPLYLYGVGKFEDCSHALEQIARMNGVKNYSAPIFALEFENENSVD